jgi:hypothetical protein
MGGGAIDIYMRGGSREPGHECALESSKYNRTRQQCLYSLAPVESYITNPYINTVALTGPSETTERAFPAPPSIPTTVSCSDGVYANRVHHQQQQHCALARPARAAALLPSHTRWRSDAVVGYQPEVCYFRF